MNHILVVEGLFQLKLKSADICQQWYSEVSRLCGVSITLSVYNTVPLEF